jgi:hypothetical protein
MMRTLPGGMTGLLSAALMLASPASAQEAPAADSQRDIIVKARPKADAVTVHKQALAITQVDDPYITPLALFQNPVCPGVIGMPRELAEVLVDRVRFNAERAGLLLAPADGCSPNLLVIFSQDGRTEVETMGRKRGYLLAGLPTPEYRAMIADKGPVHAWTNTSIKTRDGMGPSNPGASNQTPVYRMAMAHSKIYLTNRIAIDSAVVVIDIDAIVGMPVVQIADYVTMRGLARTRPVAGNVAVGTILNLFDPAAEHPGELTGFDLAYLRSLYTSLPNLPAANKLGAVAGIVRKAEKAE